MFDSSALVEKLRKFGVGRRSLGDELFGADGAPARLPLCYQDDDLSDSVEMGAGFYRCGVCQKALPAPHLLDLHVLETHDSFFATMAAHRPSYCCYVHECAEKFMNPETRLEHCIQVHRLPKDFRYDMTPICSKIKKKSKLQNATPSMEVDGMVTSQEPWKLSFHNSKQKGFIGYSGRKFTSDKVNKSSRTTNMDQVMLDLKHNLPE